MNHPRLPPSCEPDPENGPKNVLFFGRFVESNATLDIVSRLAERGDWVYCVDYSLNADTHHHLFGAGVTFLKVNTPEEAFQELDHVDCVIAWLDQGLDKSSVLQSHTGLCAPDPPAPELTTLTLLNDELETRSMFEFNTYPLLGLLKVCAAYNKNAFNFISIAAQLPFQSTPSTRAYSASRWACCGLQTCAAFESYIQGHTFRTCMVDLGLQTVDHRSANAVALAYTVGELVHCAAPPLRLPFGKEALKMVRERVRGLVEEIEDWKYLFDAS